MKSLKKNRIILPVNELILLKSADGSRKESLLPLALLNSQQINGDV
jgi:hypothetical protein